MGRKILLLALIFTMLMPMASFAMEEGGNKIIALAQDLSQEQKDFILDYFDFDESIKIIGISNQEEREYLGKYVDDKLIGSKAISSIYIEKLPEGEGIKVETHNISWVTEDMYRNALITAGIKDAKIIVASPTNASGTAALTGAIKAFEDITGQEISEEEKEIASEEIGKTANLGNEIGKDKAEELISNIKLYIINNNIKDRASIKKIVEQMAKDLGIDLTSNQVDQIISLMTNISKLNLDINQIRGQLKDISDKIDKISKQTIEIKSFLQRLVDFVIDFFNKIFGGLGS